MSSIEAVTFDFWNTLVRADIAGSRARRLEGWLAVLDERGHDIGPEVLDAVFDRVSELFNEAWSQNRQFTFDDAAAAAFTLLPGLDTETERQLSEAWNTHNEDAPVSATDGVGDALRSLSASGIALGIICDVGLTPSTVLRRYLDRLELLDYFDHVSFSDEVGTYKPDPVIFEHALEGLGGVAAARAVHIGDLRRTDVAGALGAGMTAVRYRGVADDHGDGSGPAAHHVIDHHDELVALVVPRRSSTR